MTMEVKLVKVKYSYKNYWNKSLFIHLCCRMSGNTSNVFKNLIDLLDLNNDLRGQIVKFNFHTIISRTNCYLYIYVIGWSKIRVMFFYKFHWPSWPPKWPQRSKLYKSNVLIIFRRTNFYLYIYIIGWSKIRVTPFRNLIRPSWPSKWPRRSKL